MKRLRVPVLASCLVLVAAGAVLASHATASPSKSASMTGTISVVYSESYEFDAKNLTDIWWARVKKQFEAKYPGAHLKPIPVGGTDFDEQKKAALLLRSSSTSPDIVSMETPNVGELAAANYLLPLNKYTNADKAFWPYTAKAIKDMSTFGGNVYAINSGNNVSMIFYNKAMLKKARVALPWQPKNWNDILTVARKVKAANPGVIPFWMHAGVTVGPFVGLVQSSGNLIAGSTTPIMLDRKTEHLVTGNRPSAYAKVKAGADAQGKFVAWDAETWGTGGAGAGAGFPLPYQVYVWPNRRRTHRDVYINAGPQRAFRAPGHPQSCFITEVVVDELADRLKMDPLELRLRNLPEDQPNQQWRKYFPIGAEKIGWNKRHPTGDATAGPIKRGLGCAANRWAGAGNAGTRASCEIMPDGSVVTRIATQDIGTGTRTLVAMITAETMGLPLEAVQTKIGDTNYPFAPGSGGSITVASVSATVRPACEAARDALFAKVAPGLGVEPASLIAKGGRIQSKSDASKSLSWKDACRQLGTASVTGDGAFDRTLATVGTSGVQFADVEVDIETGVTRVKRIVCLQDCGMILDKLTAESQCIGGIIMGTGFALYENRILDRSTALMVNPNMEFYLLPGMSDIPDIDVTLVDQPERGVVGLGEPPVISTAAAIANAVANAVGARIRKLPIAPDTVLAALEQERAGGTL